MKNEKHIVVVQCWEVDGIPDGYSMHMNESDRDTFIEEMKEFFVRGAVLKEEHSILRGESYELEIDIVIFNKVKASKNGIKDYPDAAPC